jgi:TIR domain
MTYPLTFKKACVASLMAAGLATFFGLLLASETFSKQPTDWFAKALNMFVLVIPVLLPSMAVMIQLTYDGFPRWLQFAIAVFFFMVPAAVVWLLFETIRFAIGGFWGVLVGDVVPTFFVSLAVLELLTLVHALGVPLTYLDVSMTRGPSHPTQIRWSGLSKKSLTTRSQEALPVARTVDTPTNRAQTTDVVRLSVFAPAQVTFQDIFMVQAIAHTPRQGHATGKMAHGFDPSTLQRGTKALQSPVSRGTTLTFDLDVPQLHVFDEAQSIVWNGRADVVQFRVGVPDHTPMGNTVGTISVSENSIPIGRVRFTIIVVEKLPASALRRNNVVGEDVKWYTLAFLPYATPDRAQVLGRAQMLTAAGIEYFQDVLSLDPGDRWERKIYLNIDACDLFVLFWSAAAKNSIWVRKETQYALARKGPDQSGPPDIKPVILALPPVPDPWPELRHIHFNDRMVYLISQEQRGQE